MSNHQSIAIEKGLPAAVEQERAVLGTCMSGDPERLEVIAQLVKSSDFSLDRHVTVWSAVEKLRSSGQPVDRVTVSQELLDSGRLERAGGFSKLSEMEDLPSAPGLIEGYCRTLRSFAIRRHAFVVGEKLQKLALTGADNETLLASLERASEAISGQKHNASKMLRVDEVYARDFDGQFPSFIGRSEQTAAIPIPWQEPLNGLRIGELTILAARPGVGKSSAAAQIAFAAGKDRIPVDIWSLEMRGGLILRRAIAGLAGVSHFRIANGFLDWDRSTKSYIGDREEKLVWQALEAACEMPIRFADGSGATTENIRSELRQARAQRVIPALVIVDYLQLLTGSGRDRNEIVGGISRGLKKITQEFPVAVLALSQLSRSSEKDGNREPRLSDLRDSGSIEQDADNVVFLHAPKVSEETASNSPITEIEWLVKKQRNGHTGMTRLSFLRDRLMFSQETN